MLAVLLVLGGAAALLALLPQRGGEAPASSAVSVIDETETVTDIAVEDVAAVAVENSQGSFTLVPWEDAFTVEGYEDSVVSPLTASNSVSALCAMTSNRTLETPDDLEPFGLSGENAVQVEIRLKDGSSQPLTLGNPAGETSGRYVLKDGAVYIVPGVPTTLYGSLYGYFSASLYTIESKEADDSSTELDILYSLRLTGAHFPEPVEVVHDDAYLGSYLLTSPIVAESGTTALLDLKDALLAPQAKEVVKAKLAPEDLAAFGLDEPDAQVSFDLNGEAHTMAVSAAKGGERYLLLDDRDAVYLVDDDQVSAWAQATVLSLRMSYIWLANIMEVERLSVTRGGEPTVFSVTRTVNEEATTDANTVYDLAVEDGAGQPVDYQAYKDFYADLLAIAVLNVDPAEYTGTPAYEVEYRYFDGGEPDTVAFYAVGSDRYAAVLNGGYSGQVRKTEADAAFAKLGGLAG